jgi:hypothetical protein
MEPNPGFGPVRVLRFNFDGKLLVTGHDTGICEVRTFKIIPAQLWLVLKFSILRIYYIMHTCIWANSQVVGVLTGVVSHLEEMIQCIHTLMSYR